MGFQTPQPEVPSPSYSETQRWVGLFFSCLNDCFSIKIMHLGWKILVPPTCDFNLSKSTIPVSRRSMGLLCKVWSEDQWLSAH